MPNVKKTKTVLKSLREALARFERYLPTLEMKKQQIRLEVSHIETAIEEKEDERRRVWEGVSRWIRLFAEDVDLRSLIRLEAVQKEMENIAGVSVSVFKKAIFVREPVDLFETPPWVDDGLDAIESLLRLEAEEQALRESRDVLSEELRITSQRVNLFEKVKIPECRESIHIIKIALGDEQAAAVARAKMAKGRMVELESAT
ncbi:MAG TPA: V-type ATP synthase subunit D, partial [Sumerlaeia bacterium]|nr:V-type ATP synthase subunit D [Sumerlaeia bacterium]